MVAVLAIPTTASQTEPNSSNQKLSDTIEGMENTISSVRLTLGKIDNHTRSHVHQPAYYGDCQDQPLNIIGNPFVVLARVFPCLKTPGCTVSRMMAVLRIDHTFFASPTRWGQVDGVSERFPILFRSLRISTFTQQAIIHS